MLKVALKNSKQEITLLQEHLDREKKKINTKTDEFLSTIDRVNAEMRKIHSYYQEKAMAKEIARLKAQLNELIELKQNENTNTSTTTRSTSASSNTLNTPMSTSCSSSCSSSTTSDSSSMTTKSLEVDVSVLTQQLKEKEDELKKVTEEFERLDKYTDALGQQCQRLQQRINTALTQLCPICHQLLQNVLSVETETDE